MKKENISYKKERVVLSEILPYETPVIFSNRGFYRFLVENKIYTVNGEPNWKSSPLAPLIEMIFKTNIKTIPFSFKISHKKGKYRELSIIHPLNQLYLVEFYTKYKEIIKYYCGVSKFSIRKPVKTAKFRYINDYLHRKSILSSVGYKNIEINNVKTEHLKSFFVYEKYNYIYKFFESNQFHFCEKKYQELYKIDISKCFDSIYTHSLSWAIYNKEIVKDNIGTSSHTFAGKLDKLMQDMNYGETNGILIGSEVSRIVAEILLQKIDKNIFDELKSMKIIHTQDYEVFRYVDDYFIFSKSKKIRKKIIKVINHQLKIYKLYINDSKSIKYKKPIITGLSIAKNKISGLLNESLAIKNLNEDKNELQDANHKKTWAISFNSRKLITMFKIIIKESNVEYINMLNYTISIIEKKYIEYILKFENEESKDLYKNEFIKFNLEIFNFLFFIYSVSPRVSSTIKIVSILSKAIEHVNNSTIFNSQEKDIIFKNILNEITLVIEQNTLKKYTENETLYLLIVLKELGNDYLIKEKKLSEYLLINENIETLNYFTITTVLYYIRNLNRFDKIKEQLKQYIIKKFTLANKDNLNINTELVLLLLDLVACPYLDYEYKKTLLEIFSITDIKELKAIINNTKYWFIKWEDFNLANEMEFKKSQEVYS